MLLSEILSGEFVAGMNSIPGLCADLANGGPLPAAAEIEAVVLSGSDAVAKAAPAWQAIERNGGASTPFQSLAVAQACVDVHRALGETPRLAVVSEGGEPVLLLPGVVGRLMGLRTLRFLGDPLIQYGDVICNRARPAHFRAAWRALATPSVVDIAWLRKVRADARIAPFLSEIATVVTERKAPFIDLAKRDNLGTRQQRKLRRRRRQLAEHGEISLVVERGAAAQRLAEEALSMKHAWLKNRGLTSSVVGERHWEDAILSLAANNGKTASLTAIGLRAGDDLAAIELGFEQGEHWHSYLGAMSPRFAKQAPGRLQIAEALERLRQDGITVYDLLAPADHYKLDLATGSIEVRDYVAPIGWRGRLVSHMTGLVPYVSAWLAHMPSGVRQRLVGSGRPS